ESGRRGDYGREEAHGWRDGRGVGRGYMMRDDDDGWRGYHHRVGRDMSDDEDGHMRHGRMHDEYDRRSDWRHDDEDDRYDRRSDRRDEPDDRYDRRRSHDMMSDRMDDHMSHSWRHDCGPRYDRRSDRYDDDRD